MNKKAKAKGLSPSTWIVRLISLYVTTELVVAFAIISFVGIENILLIMIPSLSLALLSAYFVFNQLSKFENEEEEVEVQLIEEEEKPNLDHFR